MPMLLYGNGMISGATSMPTNVQFGGSVDITGAINTSSNLLVSGSANVTQGLTTASRGINNASVPSGAVLQVVQTVKTDTWSASVASPNYTDIPSLTVNITPFYSTSKILICLTVAGNGSPGASQLYYRIMRNSTAICLGDTAGSRFQSTGRIYMADTGVLVSGSQTFLDSPATTSAITYKIQATSEGGTYTLYVNRTPSDADGSVSNGTRATSSITVMEIAQ